MRSYHTHSESSNLIYVAVDTNERRRLKRRGWEKISFGQALHLLGTRSRAMQRAGIDHFDYPQTRPYTLTQLQQRVQGRGEYRFDHSGLPIPTGTIY